MSRPLSVCYAAPGHHLDDSSGSARNVLAVADALSETADVTVAFRAVRRHSASPCKTIEIEPNWREQGPRDDVAARGMNPLAHAAYCRRLSRFARACADDYDLVLEKGWRLSGYLSRTFLQRGVPAVLVENDVRCWMAPVDDLMSSMRYLTHLAAQSVAGYCSRRIPLVIAETEQLKAALVARRGIAADRIEVVELGVDHQRFRPMDRTAAREALGWPQDRLVMLYVGGLDSYHDLAALLAALHDDTRRDLELVLAGDGELREAYESIARGASARVRFLGKIPHVDVPRLVAAADVCLAPYRTSGFHKGEVAFATLKIPEYMACARPVVSVPSGHILELIDDNVNGFLVVNEEPQWRRFLRTLPGRAELAAIGERAAERVATKSWRKTADGYLAAARRIDWTHYLASFLEVQ